MASLIIAFHSGYGHTRRLVDAALEGVATHAGIESNGMSITQ